MKMKEKTLFLITVFGYGMKTVTRKDGEVIEYRDMHLKLEILLLKLLIKVQNISSC